MTITRFDRLTAAAMHRALGHEERAAKCAAGELDEAPTCKRILEHLAAYRARFEAGEELSMQDARNAAASYLDEVSQQAFGKPDDVEAPGLRNGFDYAAPAARAFAFHHSRLLKRETAQ